MKNADFDEMDNLIREAVVQTPPLPGRFAGRTADKILALHRRRQRRRLFALGFVYFFLALAGVYGLAWVINARMAFSLLDTLIEYKYVIVFGIVVFIVGICGVPDNRDHSLLT